MTDIRCLFQMMACLFVTVCSVYKETYTSIERDQEPTNRPTKSMNAGLMLDCVLSCVMLSDCFSVTFNRTRAVCHLYDSFNHVKNNHADNLFYVVLRKTPDDKSYSNSITWNVSGLLVVVMKKKMSWGNAKSECYRLLGGCLHVIDSDTKQAMAVKMLNQSELEYVAIGANFNVLLRTWRDTWRDHTSTYSAWAKGQPSKMGLFGVLSRKSGYQWESITLRNVDGALCEKIK